MKFFKGTPSFSTESLRKFFLTGPYLLALLIGGLPAIAWAEAVNLTLTSSSNPVPSQSPVTFTAKVTAVNAAAGPVTGDINFIINNCEAYQTVSLDANGEATYTTSCFYYNSSGTVTAEFVDNSEFFDFASKSLIQLGGPAASQTAITDISPSSVISGETVTVSYTVSSIETLSGTVTVTDGSNSCNGVAVNGGGSCTLTLSGVGSHSVTASFNSDIPQVADSTSSSVTATVANRSPVAQDDSFTTEEDTGLVLDVLANDIDADGHTISFTALGTPDQGGRVVIDGDTLAYNPADNFAGTETFTYSIEDPQDGSATATVTVTVSAVNDAPVISSVPSSAMLLVGETYSGQLAATDIDGDTLTYSATGLPTWLSLDPATGVLSGSPSLADVGTSEVTLTAADAALSASDNWSITVEQGNSSPVITSTSATSIIAGESYSYQVTATDSDGDSLSFSVNSNSLPAWLTFDESTAVLSGQPAEADAGIVMIIVNVFDGTESTTQIFDLSVEVFNETPIITSTPTTGVTITETYSYTLTATDANNDPLTMSATALPGWLTFDTETHILSGTPSAENVGTSSVELLVSDGEASATQSFSINVSPELNVDLGISISSSANPVRLGQSMTVTALTTSNGNIASNVGTLEISFVGSATISHEGDCSSTVNEGVTTYTCQTGALEPSEQLSQTFTIDAATAGDIVTTASITMVDDSLPENNSDDITLTATAEIMNATEEEVGSGGTEMLAGDLNGDGEIDLLLLGGSTAAIEVYLNAGGTSWSLTTTLGGTDNTITGGELADFNGDNVLDLVVIRNLGQSNRILINNGSGVFTQSAALGNGNTNDVAVADLNNDGDNDLVFANTGANTVYMNSAGTFTLTDSLGSADSRGVAIGDITGDTLPDLIFANADSISEIVDNTSLAGTSSSASTSGSSTIRQVARMTGQFNAEALTGGDNTSDFDVAVIDYDRDGDNDLIFARGVKKQINQTDSLGNPLFENDGSGNMTETKQLGNADSRSIAVLDADNDGNVDIVSFNENGVHQLYRNFDSQFSVHGAVFDLPGTSGGAVADLDGNGLDDIVFVSEEEGSPVLLNRLAEPETEGDEWFGDLQVNLGIDLQAEATMTVGASQTVNVTLTNLEERQAEEVTLSASSEDGVQVTAATPSQGTCTITSATALSCQLGTLAQNESVTIQVDIVANSAGDKTVAATVSASRSDSSSSDNTKELEISVSSTTTPKKKGGGAIAFWQLLILLTFSLAAYRKRHL